MTVTYFDIRPVVFAGDQDRYYDAWDVRDIVTEIEWTTDIDFAAGELTFTLLEVDEGFIPQNGDRVTFKWDDNQTFFGRIFKTEYTSDEKFKITAYDDLRYLKNQDQIVWPVSTTAERFKRVMETVGLRYRIKDDAWHSLPEEIQDGKSFFEVLQSWIDETRKATGNRYFIRDVFGTIELIGVWSTQTDLLIGDGSINTSWTYDRSIDDAANIVKVVREDDNSSQRVTKVEQASDDGTVMKWGRLQIVEKADTKLNDAQMAERARQLLAENNKEKKTLSISAVGDLKIRAGQRFYISIQSLKDIGIGEAEMLATKVTHRFGPDWHMDIETEFI